MIKVVSWQMSGVAWAPWRYQTVIGPSESVWYRAFASHDGLTRYGLPEIPVASSVLDLVRDQRPDVVHIHHAYIARDLIPMVRAFDPKIKILVTIHGEPDRSLKMPCYEPPDAYHVVDPELRETFNDAPSFFIPNHPATSWAEASIQSFANRLLIPFSFVRHWKDFEIAGELALKMKAAGWSVSSHEHAFSNDQMQKEITESSATWIQVGGYFDLLTMECWRAGTVPIVLRPRLLADWSEALGFDVAAPFDDASIDALAGRLLGDRASLGIECNRLGMAAAWTPSRARGLWEALFRAIT